MERDAPTLKIVGFNITKTEDINVCGLPGIKIEAEALKLEDLGNGVLVKWQWHITLKDDKKRVCANIFRA